jgi:hypothetical protein
MYGGSWLSTMMEALGYLWPPLCMLLALASLVVAVVCTMRKRYLVASWLMFACWSVFALSVTVNTIMWLPSLGLYGSGARWIQHFLSLVEILCELGFGISVLLFRPDRIVVGEGVDHG